jgi:signal transduction histidine kinase
LETPLSPVALDATAVEAMSPILEAASDKGIQVSASCGPVTVLAHRDMLVTVLRNLISNAVKFTLPGGSVKVAVRMNGGHAEIAVTDTGIGMAPAVVADLLNSDKRTTSAGTAGERGSGFGLLICRNLLDRMGARLHVRSVIDQGTTFSFRLPVAEVAVAVPETAS